MRPILFVFVASLAWSQTAIIPHDYSAKAGDNVLNYIFSGYPATTQCIYSESYVLASGIKPGDSLTGIRFRMAFGQVGGPPFQFTYANWDATLSKSTRAVGTLTSFIQGNMANDAVPVRRGSLIVPANSMPTSGRTVNDFGLLIPFSTNYVYTGGALLLTMSHDLGEWDGSRPVDAVTEAANLQCVAVLRYNVANATQAVATAPIIQFTYTRPASGPAVTAAGVLNAASYGAGGVAPGQIVTIYGERLGQSAVVAATLTNSKFNTTAGNTRVLFDGIPAPMIYSSEKQLAAIVPYATAGKTATQLEVEVSGVKGQAATVPIVASSPGIFTADSSGKGQAAVLNENGSLNTPTNPAAPGSIVVIYLTGEGQTNPAGSDGSLALGATLPKPALPVSATIGGVDAEILYAGAAPGAVAGLMQINARIGSLAPPSNTSPLVVKIGDKTSQAGVTIAVR
jgi:uncharacterized protein (TIGR03437 family)